MKNLSASDSPDKPSSRLSLKLIDSRVVALTLFNVLLYWPWRWLRSAYDAGIHHPDLVLVLMGFTLWGWWQLVMRRINNGPRH